MYVQYNKYIQYYGVQYVHTVHRCTYSSKSKDPLCITVRTYVRTYVHLAYTCSLHTDASHCVGDFN